MRRLPFALLLALGLTVPALAAPPSLRDFQLPPEPSPTPSAQVEGPVDRDGPVIIAPRAIPTASPTPSPTRSPVTVPTLPAEDAQTATGAPTTGAGPAVRGQPQPGETPAARSGVPVASDSMPVTDAGEAAGFEDLSAPQGTDPAATAPQWGQAPTAGQQADAPPPGIAWLWWALGAAGLVGLGLAGWFLRSRPALSGGPAPAIERPVVKPKPPPGTPQAPSPALAAAPLRIEAEVASLSRSFANATLSYAINLSNRSGRTLHNVRIAADMTTAHGSLPVDQQVANGATELPDFARFDQFAPGETREARGEFRLPVNQIRLIRQGSAALYVPLLRLRIHADGIDPVVQTFVVGRKQVGPNSRLTPFRLDEMAQIYREVALRPLG